MLLCRRLSSEADSLDFRSKKSGRNLDSSTPVCPEFLSAKAVHRRLLRQGNRFAARSTVHSIGSGFSEFAVMATQNGATRKRENPMSDPLWNSIQRIACAEVRRKGFRNPDTIDDLLQTVVLSLISEQNRHPELSLEDLVKRTRCRTLDAIKSHHRAEDRQRKAIESQSVISVRLNGGPLI